MSDPRPFDYVKAIAGRQEGIRFHQERITKLNDEIAMLILRQASEEKAARAKQRNELQQTTLDRQCAMTGVHGPHIYRMLIPPKDGHIQGTNEGPYYCEGRARR